MFRSVSLSVLFFHPGYFILVALAIRLESPRLHRLGWVDGRPRCMSRLQESYTIAVSLFDLLLGDRDGAKVAGYCRRKSQGKDTRARQY